MPAFVNYFMINEMASFFVLCYVVLQSILLLMVKLSLKYLIGNQGMLPMPAAVKDNVLCQGKRKKKQGTILLMKKGI